METSLVTQEKKILGLTTSAHSIVHLFELAIPPLFPLLVTAFGVTYFQLGLLITIFSYAFGIGSLPAGILADSLGPRKLISLYLLGAGVLSLLVWVVQGYLFFAVIVCATGAFCSLYHPAATTLIAKGMQKQGKAFGIHGIAGSLGTALSPVLAAWLGTLISWKAPFLVFGLLSLGVGLFSLSLPSYKETVSIDREKGDGKRESLQISVPLLVLYYAIAAFIGLGYKGAMTFLPVFIGERVTLGIFGLNKITLGGSVATLALIAGVFGQYYGGKFADIYKTEKLYFISTLFCTITLLAMTFTGNIILILSAMIFALFYFSVQPMQNVLLAKIVPPKRQGLGYGIQFFVSFGVGSSSAALAGYLADRYDLKYVFLMLTFCFLVALVCAAFFAYFLRKKTPVKRSP